jgi:plastocyanin
VVAAPKTISIKNFAFSPVSLTVKKWTTIVWKNDDTVPHNIVFDTFSSDKLQTGDTYSHKFSDVGDYSYKCGIHPTMTGTIVVIN